MKQKHVRRAHLNPSDILYAKMTFQWHSNVSCLLHNLCWYHVEEKSLDTERSDIRLLTY